jgi:hypothetical protein
MRYYNYNCMSEKNPGTPEYDAESLGKLAENLHPRIKKSLQQDAKKFYISQKVDSFPLPTLEAALEEIQDNINDVIKEYNDNLDSKNIQVFYIYLEVVKMMEARIKVLSAKTDPSNTTPPTLSTKPPQQPQTAPTADISTTSPQQKQETEPTPRLYPTNKVIPAHEPNRGTQEMYTNGTDLGKLIELAKKQDQSKQLPSNEQQKYNPDTRPNIRNFPHLPEEQLAEINRKAKFEIYKLSRKYKKLEDLTFIAKNHDADTYWHTLVELERDYADYVESIDDRNNLSDTELTKITQFEERYYSLQCEQEHYREFVQAWGLPELDQNLDTENTRLLDQWKQSIERSIRKPITLEKTKSLIETIRMDLAQEPPHFNTHDKAELTQEVRNYLLTSKNEIAVFHSLHEYEQTNHELTRHTHKESLAPGIIKSIELTPSTSDIAPRISEQVESIYEQCYTPDPLSIKPRVLAGELARIEALATDPHPFDTFNAELHTRWNDPSWDMDAAYEIAEQAHYNQQYLASLRTALSKLRNATEQSAAIDPVEKQRIIDSEQARHDTYTAQIQANRAIVTLHEFYNTECTIDPGIHSTATIDIAGVFDLVVSSNALATDFDMGPTLDAIRDARGPELQSQQRTMLLQEQSDTFKRAMKLGGPEREQINLLEKGYQHYIRTKDASIIQELNKKKASEIEIQKKIISDNSFNITKLAFDEQFIRDYGQDPATVQARFVVAHTELAGYFTPNDRPLVEDLDDAIANKLTELQQLTLQYHRCVKYFPAITLERSKLYNATPAGKLEYQKSHEHYATASKWTHNVRDALGNIVSTIEYRNASDAQELIAKETETLWKNHWKTSSIADLHIELSDRTHKLNTLRSTRDVQYTEFLEAFGHDRSDQFDALSEWKESQQDVCVAELHAKELQKYLNAFPLPNAHECAPDVNNSMKCTDTGIPLSASVIASYQRNPGTPAVLRPTIDWIERVLTHSSGHSHGVLGMDEISIDSYTGKHGVLESLDRLKKKLEGEVTQFRKSQNASSMTLLVQNSDDTSPSMGFHTLALAYLEKRMSELRTEFRSNYIIDNLPTNILDPEQAQKQKTAYEKHIVSECGKLSESIYQISNNTYSSEQKKAEDIQGILIHTFMHANQDGGDFRVYTDIKGNPRKELIINGDIHYGELARRAIEQFAFDAMNSEPAYSLLQKFGLSIPLAHATNPNLSDSERATIALTLKRDNNPDLDRVNPAQADAQRTRESALGLELLRIRDTLSNKAREALILYEDYPKTKHFVEQCYTLAQNFYAQAHSAGFELDAPIGNLYIVTQVPATRALGDKAYTPVKSKDLNVSGLLQAFKQIEDQLDFVTPSGKRDKPNYGDLIVAAGRPVHNSTASISEQVRIKALDSLFVRSVFSDNGAEQLVFTNIEDTQIPITSCIETLQRLQDNRPGELLNLKRTCQKLPWFKQLDIDSLLTEHPFDPSTATNIVACSILISHTSMLRSIGISTRKFANMFTSGFSNLTQKLMNQ